MHCPVPTMTIKRSTQGPKIVPIFIRNDTFLKMQFFEDYVKLSKLVVYHHFFTACIQNQHQWSKKHQMLE